MTALPIFKGAAYITGAASGLGRATAFSFAKYGVVHLALTDINHKDLLSTAADIRDAYPHVEIEAIELDVCNNFAVETSVLQTVARFGRIGVGINNAGITGKLMGTAGDGAVEDWERVVNVNLNGVYSCHRALLQAMLVQENLGPREGRGNIINMASMFGVVGTPSDNLATPYAATKHAVVGLSKSDATTYAARGIRINAMCPGYIDTPLLREAKEMGMLDKEIARVPMGRLGMAEEIADAIFWMASPGASFMTGSSMVVDGGYSAC